MKRKHYVVNIEDDDFEQMMATLRLKMLERSDGNVIKNCVRKTYEALNIPTLNKVNFVNTIERSNKVKSINGVDKINFDNFVKTIDIKEGCMSMKEIQEALGASLSPNKMAERLKSLGFKQKKTKNARVWLVKRK